MIFTFAILNLYNCANLSFVGAPRSHTRGHFLLDQKVTKNSIFAIRVRIKSLLPLLLTRCAEQLPVAESHFMFGRQSAAAISRTTYCAIIQLSTRV